MAKQVVVLFACFFLLALIQPSSCVSRVFTDEITGYNTPLVTADDVATELMIVNTITVEGPIVSDSEDGHSVDTPGKMTLTAEITTVSASDSINLESYGENVGFYGDNVDLGANGAFSNDAVHTSMASDEISLLGDSLETVGVHVNYRAPSEIFFAANDDISFKVFDALNIATSEIDINGTRAVTFGSALSNVHLEAGNTFLINGTTSVSMTGASGAKILSKTNEVNIFSEDLTTLIAENIQLNGISQSGVISKGGYFNLTAQDFDVTSDRTIISAVGMNVTTRNDGGLMNFISFGTILASANHAVIFSHNVDITAADEVRFTSYMGATYNSSQDTTINSGSTYYRAYQDILFSSTDGYLTMDYDGVASIGSENDDFSITSPTQIYFGTFNAKVNAAQTFSANANAFEVVASEYIEFLSQGDMFFQLDTFTQTTEEFEIFARENAILSAVGDATFTSTLNTLHIESSADIIFSSANMDSNANSISYSAPTLMKIKAHDEIAFNATDSVYVSSGNRMIFGASDIYFNADELIMTNRNYELYSDDVDISAFAVLITTADIGAFSFQSHVYVLISSYVDLAADQGGIDFTSESDIDITATGDLSLTSNDVLFSAFSSLSVSGPSGINFNADSDAQTVIYGLIETTFNAQAGGFDFEGDTTFSAPVARGDSVVFNVADTSITADTSASIVGGTTAINVAQDFTSSSTIYTAFGSGNGEDLTLTTLTSDITFNGGSSFSTFGTTIVREADDNISYTTATFTSTVTDSTEIVGIGAGITYTTNALSVTATADDGWVLLSGDSGLDITATTFLNTFDSYTTIEGEVTNTIASTGNSITVSTSHGSINAHDNTIDDTDTVFNTLGELSAVYHLIDINVETSVTITTNDFTAQSTNKLNFLTQADISVTATSGMNAQGGDISVVGTTSLNIISDQNLYFGSNDFAIYNLNYHDVILDTYEDININANYWSVVANDNHDYNDTAIATYATDFVLSCRDHLIYGDNGVVFNSGDYTNTVTDFIDFISQFGSHEVVSGTMNVVSAATIAQAYLAHQAGFYAYAETAIFYDVTGSFTSTTVESSLHSTFDNAASSTFTALNDINIHAGDRFTFLNGDAKQLGGIFRLFGQTGIEITSGNDMRYRTFGADTANPAAMVFSTKNSNVASQGMYHITIDDAINMYPSGDVIIGRADLTFTSRNRNITMGTTQGDMISTFTSTVSYTAGHDYNVTAGGLNGNVFGQIDGDGTYQSNDLNVFSNFTTTIDSVTDISVTAGERMKFTTFREESGIYHKAQGDITYESQILTGTTGINITGNALTSYSSTQTIFDTYYFEVGQNNAQFNPRVTANVGDWNVVSVGTISLNALNDDFVQDSVALSSASTTTVFKAGGSMNFRTTWDTLTPGDGILAVSADNLFSVLAQNIIDINIRDDGTVTAPTTIFTSSGTSTSSPTASGIVFKGNNGEITFDANTFNQKINTSTTIHAGNVDVSSTALTSLISSNGYIQLESDKDITSRASSEINFITTASNARMEFFTEGASSPITFFSTLATDIESVVDQIFFNSGGKTTQTAAGAFTLTTGQNNNGQLTLDATNNVVIDGNTVGLTTARDFYIDTEGEDSKFNIGVFTDFVFDTTQDVSFNTVPGGDGSIKFLLQNKATFEVKGTKGFIDSDDKFSVLTNGSFIYTTEQELETSVGGYLDISSNHSILLRANNPSSSVPAHIVFNANASDFIAASKQSTHFESGFSGFGNITFNLAGDASIIARGNDSGVTQSGLDVYSQGGATVINSQTGDLDIQGLHRVSMLAYGSVNNSGYVSFVSRNTAAQDKVEGDGISLHSTHRGGDIYFTGVGADFFATDISFVATGTSVETGFISIINTPPYDASVPGFNYDTRDLFENPAGSLGALFDADQPALKFDSGIETKVYADTGDLIVNYGKRCLLHGGSIAGIATGGITFFTRGDGRLTNRIIGGDYPLEDTYTTPLASFITHNLDGVTFRTLNAGLGEIRFVSEAGHIRVVAEYAYIRNNEDQLLFEASSTIQLQSRAASSQFPGIVVHSEDYVTFNALDQEIISTGRNIRYGVLNNNGLLSIDSHANTDSAVNFESDNFFMRSAYNEFDIYGNIDVFSTVGMQILAIDDINIYGPNDVNIYYDVALNIIASQVVFSTDPNQYISTVPLSEYQGEIQFSGHLPNNPELYNSGFAEFSEVYDNVAGLPVVTFDTDLYIYYTTGRQRNVFFQPGVRGGYCEFDRSFMFAVSQLNFNLCICLDNVWLCNNRFEGMYFEFGEFPGPYPGYYEPAGHYLYEIPFQMLGWGAQ